MEPMMSGPGPIGSGSGWSTPTTGFQPINQPQPAQQQDGRMGIFRGEGGGMGRFGGMRSMNPNPFGMGGMMGYGMPFGMMGGYGGYGGMGGMGYGMPQMGYGGMGGFGGYGGMGQMDGYGGMGGLGMGFGGMGGYGMNPFAMQGYGRRPRMQPQPSFDQQVYPDMRLNGPGSPEDPNRFGGQPMQYDYSGRRYGDPYFGTGGPGLGPTRGGNEYFYGNQPQILPTVSRPPNELWND